MHEKSPITASPLLSGLCGAFSLCIGLGSIIAGLVLIQKRTVTASGAPVGAGDRGKCRPRPGEGFLCEAVSVKAGLAYNAVLNATIALTDGSVSNCSRFLGKRHEELAACQRDAQDLLGGQERNCVSGAGQVCEELVEKSTEGAFLLIVGGGVVASVSAGWLGAVFVTRFVERTQATSISIRAVAHDDDSMPPAAVGRPMSPAPPGKFSPRGGSAGSASSGNFSPRGGSAVSRGSAPPPPPPPRRYSLSPRASSPRDPYSVKGSPRTKLKYAEW